MDIPKIIAKLDAYRGYWTVIGSTAQIDRRTIHRIVNEPDYNPTVGTLRSLDDAMTELRRDRILPSRPKAAA